MAVVYVVIGVVVYYYCGSYVASPALGSAGKLLKRVCYGLAFPGLCVSTLLFVHVSMNRKTPVLITAADILRLQQSMSSFVHCAALTTSRIQHFDIGLPGLDAPLVSH